MATPMSFTGQETSIMDLTYKEHSIFLVVRVPIKRWVRDVAQRWGNT